MKKVLCFGDSNTWGHNPEDGSGLERRWPVVLAELLPECDIIQDGVCGRSTKFDVPDTPNSNGIEVFRERYLNSDNDFDLIIIMLGTNDQLNYLNCSASETAEALRLFATGCRDKFGRLKPDILLVSPIYIRKCALVHPIFKDLYSEKSVAESKLFAENILKIASQEDVYFLNAAEYASASEKDGVHMDAVEHGKLANAIAEKIKLILFQR